MKKAKKLKKGGIMIREDGTQIGFGQVSNMFMEYQMELSGSAVKVYLYLIWQAGKIRSLEIEADRWSICYHTGIKNKDTVTKAIRELILKGWINNIYPKIDNSLIYVINPEREKVNYDLVKWLNERGKKHSENSKRNIKKGTVLRGEDGKFIKKDNKQ
jgi:predicted DNA-binding transcriptional regulator